MAGDFFGSFSGADGLASISAGALAAGLGGVLLSGVGKGASEVEDVLDACIGAFAGAFGGRGTGTVDAAGADLIAEFCGPTCLVGAIFSILSLI